MRILHVMLLALACVLPAYGAEESRTGVIWRATKDKTNAEAVDKVQAKVGQFIEIDWRFEVVPEHIPASNDAKSSDPSVSVTGISSILTVPQKEGKGIIAASFKAERVGTSTLTFTLKNKSGIVVLTCEVEVVK
jgi:hypothetical protein